ncbi:MAG: hypothetical protein LBL04_09365 [Bacteroidales bacterium]|jgi:hypothetical protein|nr:hypothetical protein [Bacteroidales bacterium]
MSKQKKKKPNLEARKKVLLAQNRNEYIRKVQWFCSLLGGRQYFKLLEKGLDFLFCMRSKAMKIVAGNDKVPEEFTAYVKQYLNRYITGKRTELYEGGPEISYHDWLFVVVPVQIYLGIYPELRDADGIIDKLMENNREKWVKIMVDIANKAESIGLVCSDFSDYFLQVKYKFHMEKKEGASARLSSTVTITASSPVWRQVKVGAGKRMAARVGWSFSDSIHWMSIDPAQLGIKNTEENRPMDVYMQKHALNRMHERIDGRYIDIMNHDLIISFFELKAFPTSGGNFLIEYRISDMKAGYFVATITDQVLLIRTFLFITHIGTPEGRKLAAITGLGKLDQKYLAFDNLLTLVNSDILSNEEAKEIFIHAGCGELLDLCRVIRDSKNFWEVSEQEKPLAEKFLNYIKSAKEEISDEILDFWATEE